MSQTLDTSTLHSLIQKHLRDSCPVGCNGGGDCRCAQLAIDIKSSLEPKTSSFGHSQDPEEDFEIEIALVIANTVSNPQTPEQAVEIYNRIQRAKAVQHSGSLGNSQLSKQLLDAERAWMEKMHQLAAAEVDEMEDLRRLVCKLAEFAVEQGHVLPEFYKNSLHRVWLRSWSNTNKQGLKKLLLIEGRDSDAENLGKPKKSR